MMQVPSAITQHLELATEANSRVVIGNDLVHMSTFIKSCTPFFKRRGYTQEEVAYCEQFSEPILRYASTWAAKEAVYKAVKQLDSNIRIWWRDIEISRPKPQGRPTVTIKKLQFPVNISVTISHDGDYVWALAIMTRVGNKM